MTTVGEDAFNGCTKLECVILGNSVKTIEGTAFASCTRLAEIHIPASLTSIGYSSFDRCTGMERVYITDLEAWCKISFDITANPMYFGADLYLNNELVTELVIPDTISSIKKYAFYGCESITSVVIPQSVTYIGSDSFQTFEDSSNLKAVYYAGTTEEWGSIFIDIDNYTLKGATRYYYSETEPATAGNYWHYVDGVPTAW